MMLAGKRPTRTLEQGSASDIDVPENQERGAVTAIRLLLPIVALCAAFTPAALAAEPAGRITGVGGIFFKSKDPKALMAWYRDVLGIKVETWGGVMMRYDAPGHPPLLTLNVFGQKSDYFAPSTREFMLDFAVDDLSAFLDRLKAKGVTVLKRDDSDPSGKFAWILDPDGTKIELWEPAPK
jgi:predicted enzyme related to lactoylglutathione lyase